MSQQLINHSPDLQSLRNDGFDIEVKDGYLLVKNVPYVNESSEVKAGTVVSELTLAGNVTTTPSDHKVYFEGEHPCHKDGSRIETIVHSSSQQQLAAGITVHHCFSNKPAGGYKDYHHKISNYVNIISGPAEAVDPSKTARAFAIIESTEAESVFNYIDTASSRAEIVAISKKLELPKVAIIGLGGTGAYVLDLVAKTPVKQIDLFDKDKLLQHNAFRSPGAPSIEELRAQPYKVDYFKAVYSKLHRGIVANPYNIDSGNVEQLTGMAFVFVCIDKNEVKKPIVDFLERNDIPFVDVGMGINEVDGALQGNLRITTSTNQQREHVKNRIDFSPGEVNNEYARNVQIADLNALNAALAVVKWKKIFGFYQDTVAEHHSIYAINCNSLVNADDINADPS